MLFTSKIIAERSATPSRSSIKENEYFIHCFVRHDNLTGICVTDEEYQARVAFTLLNKVLNEFSDRVPATEWPRITNEKDCKFDKLDEYLIKWQNPREADALTRVQVILYNTI